MNYQVLCMSFDGGFIKEGNFETIEDAWEHSCNMGSRWIFYPFHFVVKNKTIKSTPQFWDFFENKRIKTVSKILEKMSKKEELQNACVEDYFYYIAFSS